MQYSTNLNGIFNNSKISGEVALHRLTWARAWILSPPSKNVNVECITFRPDGNVLAIAYDNGRLFIS